MSGVFSWSRSNRLSCTKGVQLGQKRFATIGNVSASNRWVWRTPQMRFEAGVEEQGPSTSVFCAEKRKILIEAIQKTQSKTERVALTLRNRSRLWGVEQHILCCFEVLNFVKSEPCMPATEEPECNWENAYNSGRNSLHFGAEFLYEAQLSNKGFEACRCNLNKNNAVVNTKGEFRILFFSTIFSEDKWVDGFFYIFIFGTSSVRARKGRAPEIHPRVQA